MKTFSVSVPFHCDVNIEVAAMDESEAIELALEKVKPYLCHQCSNDITLGEWTGGEPEAIEV